MATPPSARRVGPRSVKSFASSTADRSTAAATRPPPARPVSLAKRILFPSLPADADLPPLLLSPAAAPELNAELYDFIALALRAYVNVWWSKITRYDKEFLPEVTRILTVVMRTLEARLVATDLSPLVLRDLPTLLNQHWTDYRNAHSKLHTSYAVGGAASLAQLFHQMQPHMAVSADGVVDPVYVRQAVDHILKTCLPPEDYEPETERYIVREIILKVLVGSVLPRVTQPWFIHKIILDQLGPETPRKATEVSDLPRSCLGSTRHTYIYSRVSTSLCAPRDGGCTQHPWQYTSLLMCPHTLSDSVYGQVDGFTFANSAFSPSSIQTLLKMVHPCPIAPCYNGEDLSTSHFSPSSSSSCLLSNPCLARA